MRIASFNINSINRRLPNLLAWLRETEPDVVSLQELKATDAAFPVKAIQEAGYEAVWRGQKVIAHPDGSGGRAAGKCKPFKVRRMAWRAPMVRRLAVSMTDLMSA